MKLGNFGSRGKLFLLSFVLIAIAESAVGFYLERELRTSLESRIEAEVARHARVTIELVQVARLGRDAPLEETDALADRIAESTGTRITLIAADGVVLGDSDLAVEEVRKIDNHANRPEVRAAFERGQGGARRYSTTIEDDMLYVAIPFEVEGERAVARAGLPLREVAASIARLRGAVVMAVLVGVGISGLVLIGASMFVARTLRNVVSTAQAVAAGRGRAVSDDADVDGLAGSLNRMAEELEHTMGMLAAERDRFETVLQTMDQAVLALDAEHRISTLNLAARSLLRLSGEVEGRTLLEAVRVPALKELVEMVEPGRSSSAEFDLPGAPARRVQARATLQADRGVVVVVHDVTEIRRLERVRRDFVANVSHELRTPISVIRANTETLLGGALEQPERARQFVEALFRHADRLGRIIADLLDISRIEAGRYRLEREHVCLADAVERVFEALESEAEGKKIELVLDVKPNVAVDGDAKAIEHVLINLVGNAIKYTPEGGRVEVGAQQRADGIRVEVRDDGAGIDPAHRERVFERFYRVDPGRSRDMGGTGLGLAIVKHLIEAMEGEVGVDPRRPHGSIFWFRLAASDEEDVARAREPRDSSPSASLEV
jgi:two-component system, OmpR family, phosphate regulon sensor histidine kinase PhoR